MTIFWILMRDIIKWIKYSMSDNVSILGGGIAGLATAFVATNSNISFTLYEANSKTGGNCSTFHYDDFLYDSGSHRLHDKIPYVTQYFHDLLGDDLNSLNIPSKIVFDGKFINFPITPIDFISKLGLKMTIKVLIEIFIERFKKKKFNNFREQSIHNYGKTIADNFLLNYSEKLWGVSCEHLSPKVSGKRLEGLSLASIIKQLFLSQDDQCQHLDGKFYYPKKGIGMLTNSLVNNIGSNHVQLDSKVTRIFHDNKKIKSIEINGKDNVNVDEVVSTLPMSNFIKLLHPKPEQNILQAAEKIQFRNVVLVFFALNKKTVTPYGSLYFPQSCFPFTRVYEPRNRSNLMAPTGQTSLVAEIPCQYNGVYWTKKDADIIEIVKNHLSETKLINRNDVINSEVSRLHNAYPVLEDASIQAVSNMMNYVSRFENISFSGRAGRFEYTHIHDDFVTAQSIINKMNNN
jgi:protoporphyrinogen oxidase